MFGFLETKVLGPLPGGGSGGAMFPFANNGTGSDGGDLGFVCDVETDWGMLGEGDAMEEVVLENR